MKLNILLLITTSAYLQIINSGHQNVLIFDINSTFQTQTPSIPKIFQTIGSRAVIWGGVNGYTNEAKATQYFYDQLRRINSTITNPNAKDHHGCDVPPVVQEWMTGTRSHGSIIEEIEKLDGFGRFSYGKQFLKGMAQYMAPNNVAEALKPRPNIETILKRLQETSRLVLVGNISPDGQTELRKKYKEIFDLFGEHVLTSAVIRQTLPCGNTMTEILRRCNCEPQNALFVTPINYEKDMGVEVLQTNGDNLEEELTRRGPLPSPLSNFEALKIK